MSDVNELLTKLIETYGNIFREGTELRLSREICETLKRQISTKEIKILDWNRERLYEGERDDESPIEPEYTPFTVRIKQSKGQPTDRVTLKDTGGYYGSLAIEYEEDGFRIVSDDWRGPTLMGKYGEGILGLTEAQIDELKEEITPLVVDDILTQLNNALI